MLFVRLTRGHGERYWVNGKRLLERYIYMFKFMIMILFIHKKGTLQIMTKNEQESLNLCMRYVNKNK